MSDQKIGNCLPLYLKNRLLLSALADDDDGLPVDSGDDKKLLAQFRERASDQALAVLEDLYSPLLGDSLGVVPYRSDRARLRLSTIRQHWYIEGGLLRKHEKMARLKWDLFLGALRDKGPAVTFVVRPQDGASSAGFDELATNVAKAMELDSANAQTCFTHKAGFESGVVISFASLSPGVEHKDLVKTMKEQLTGFFGKFRTQLEAAIDS